MTDSERQTRKNKPVTKKGLTMKKVFALLIALALMASVTIAPVYAGGDKNQHENGAETAPGPGDDAQGNQVGGD
jgi:hypothetical protein